MLTRKLSLASSRNARFFTEASYCWANLPGNGVHMATARLKKKKKSHASYIAGVQTRIIYLMLKAIPGSEDTA